MSPLRIETCRTTVDGTKIRTVQSADRTFPLEPRETRALLDLSHSAILYHLDPKNPPMRGHRDHLSYTAHDRRLFDDRTLLKIAAETQRLEIREDKKTGLTEMVGEDRGALLDIPWQEAHKVLEEVRKRPPFWQRPRR